MPASAPHPMPSLLWNLAPPQSSSTRPLPRPTMRSAWRPPCATRSKPGAMRISPVAFRAAAVPNLQARSSGSSVHEACTRKPIMHRQYPSEKLCDFIHIYQISALDIGSYRKPLSAYSVWVGIGVDEAGNMQVDNRRHSTAPYMGAS